MPSHPSYLEDLFIPGNMARIAENAAKALEHPYFAEVDFICGTGMSGTPIAGAIAARVNKSPMLIRKEPTTHDTTLALYGLERPGSQYIIVDDCISSGDTMRRIIDAVSEGATFGNIPRAIFLYGRWNTKDTRWIDAENGYPMILIVNIGQTLALDLSSIPEEEQTPPALDEVVPSAPLPRLLFHVERGQPWPSFAALPSSDDGPPSDYYPRVESPSLRARWRPYENAIIRPSWGSEPLVSSRPLTLATPT